jgi:hypothetical protein
VASHGGNGLLSGPLLQWRRGRRPFMVAVKVPRTLKLPMNRIEDEDDDDEKNR